MLTIRQDQMEALDEDARERFRKRLMVYLREELPFETRHQSDEELHEHVLDCERRAERLGLLGEAGIAQFACLTYEDPRFDEDQDFVDFMNLYRTYPEEQLARVVETWDEGTWRQEIWREESD